MNLDDVRKIKVPRSKRHRVGRGPGSGWGKTAGRGHKGAGQRSGTRFRLHFEGGQMPLYRRLPKKGFSNSRFKTTMHVVNVGDLDKVFDAGVTVDLDALKANGLAPKRARFLKVLGFGDLTKTLEIKAHGVSAGAREKIEGAKGSIELLPIETEMRPKGVPKAGNKARNEARSSASKPAAAPVPRADAPAPEAAPPASGPDSDGPDDGGPADGAGESESVE